MKITLHDRYQSYRSSIFDFLQNHLQKEWDAMEEQMEVMEEAHHELQDAQMVLDSLNEKNKEEIEQLKRIRQKLYTENKEMERGLKHLSSELHEAHSVYREQKEELELKEKQIEELHKKLNLITASRNGHSRGKDEYINKYVEVKCINEELLIKIANMSDEMHRLKEECKNQLEYAQRGIKARDLDLYNYEKLLQEKNKHNMMYEEMLEEKEKELKRVQQLNEACVNENMELKNEISVAKMNLRIGKNQYDDLNENCRKEIKQIEEQFDAERNNYVDAINQLKKMHEALETENKKHKTSIECITNELKNVKENYKKDIHTYASMLDKVKKENEEYKEVNQLAWQKIGELEEANKNVIVNLEVERDQLRINIKGEQELKEQYYKLYIQRASELNSLRISAIKSNKELEDLKEKLVQKDEHTDKILNYCTSKTRILVCSECEANISITDKMYCEECRNNECSCNW